MDREAQPKPCAVVRGPNVYERWYLMGGLLFDVASSVAQHRRATCTLMSDDLKQSFQFMFENKSRTSFLTSGVRHVATHAYGAQIRLASLDINYPDSHSLRYVRMACIKSRALLVGDHDAPWPV